MPSTEKKKRKDRKERREIGPFKLPHVDDIPAPDNWTDTDGNPSYRPFDQFMTDEAYRDLQGKHHGPV